MLSVPVVETTGYVCIGLCLQMQLYKQKRGILDASFYILKTINYLIVIGNSTVVLSHPITRFATLP